MGTKPASFLLRRAILPYLQHHFSLSPTPFYPIPHAVLPYPPRRFTLSPTSFCLIRHAILPYLQHHFALSPTSFHLIPKAIFSPFHLFTFSPFHLFTPLLTTTNILVLRILAPRKPFFYAPDAMMLHAHWPMSQCALSKTTT